MNLYIYSAGAVSPAITADDQGRHLATEPDYAGIIPPMQLRRMTKGLRIGIAAAKMALDHAGVQSPDAICIGTAMGMLADTEVFLSKMVAQGETLLTPTAFIQSTHNTVSGAIALMLGCTGHNITFVQRGLSFEHALTGAALYLAEHPGITVLCGGTDELTPTSHTLLKAGGAYAREGGEGAAFFVLGDEPRDGGWELRSLQTGSRAALSSLLEAIPESLRIATDVVVSGADGESAAQLAEYFPGAEIQACAQETGAYATVSGNNLARLFRPGFTGKQVLLVHSYLDEIALYDLRRV